MKKRCSSHRGDRRRHITPANYIVTKSDDFAPHGKGKRAHWVPLLRAYLRDRNKYHPKTADRPKEAMKAARRARP